MTAANSIYGSTGSLSGYGYPQPTSAASNQITKRPLTQAEKGAGLKFFKTLQMQLRIFAFIPLILILINILLLASNSIISLIALIFSFVIIIVSISFLVFRRKVLAAINQGMAIEVRAPAYRSNTAQKMPGYTVGPITLFSTPEIEKLILSGSETCVACIPQLNIALSVNNTMLTQGSRVLCPPNLEAMAQPAHAVLQHPMVPTPQPAYPRPPLEQPPSYPPLTPPPSQTVQHQPPQPNQPQMQQPQTHVTACPKCNEGMEYVQQYSRWYCRRCQRYPKMHELYPPPPPEA